MLSIQGKRATAVTARTFSVSYCVTHFVMSLGGASFVTSLVPGIGGDKL